jgi:SAM-dependent methyltransferase
MTSKDPVAEYYDRNTARFLRFGGSRDSYAIHRELWGPGVRSAREAADYVNGWLAGELRRMGLNEAPSILDLGCGVGGTLFRLAESFPEGCFQGVTISPRQVEIGDRLRSRKGLEGRIRLLCADFHSVELDLEADAVVAVESFAHSRAPEGFMASAVRHLRPGGVLIVVDDFLARPRNDLGGAALGQVRELEAGWRLGSLCTVEELEVAGRKEGLDAIHVSDFTGLIRPGRPRDRAIALLTPAFRAVGLLRIPFFANMIGGNALQVGLRDGFLRYSAVVFRKGG